MDLVGTLITEVSQPVKLVLAYACVKLHKVCGSILTDAFVL